MPEYRTPGVYVEEVSFRQRTIEGVGTTTAAFVGPTLRDPGAGRPEAVTSFAEFERVYGGPDNIRLAGVDTPNFVAHAARAFFAEGGKRLYVAPVPLPTRGRPLAARNYIGKVGRVPTGLAALDECDDVSIVAAPGATANESLGRDVMQALIRHVEQHHDRFAVLDPVRGQTIREARALRGDFRSSRAALYYPWVRTADPAYGTRRRLTLPPSGFICGIYARSDIAHGVNKAPANEVIRSALGFERAISSRQQEILNRQGINCLRTLPGRGNRVWGARTVSSDPEWKYVSVRRYFIYLEQSIDRGTQWAVFEPNGEPLWAQIRQSVENFLFNEFRAGRMAGNRPEDAFFVRCDRSTMTRNDIDNGRLICLVGVAPVRPAEFVIFRIAQKTADAKS